MPDTAASVATAADTAPAVPPDPARPDPPAGGTPPPPADQGIVDALAQLSFLVQGALGKVATDHGVSIIQLRLLGVLRDREPGMQELARHLGLDKSSMTGLVDRAERRGLVRRAAAPHDGRAVRVSLTAQGHDLANAATADADRQIHALAEGLTDAQRTRLSQLASILVAGHTTI